MMDHALLQDFITEAGEHLEELESGLLKLESDPEDGEVLNEIFRSVHSIKGAAQFVGLDRISSLTHRLETLLDLARNKQISLRQDVVDILMASKDRLAGLTEDLVEGQSEQTPVDDLIAAIDRQIEPSEPSDAVSAAPPSTETPTTEPDASGVDRSSPLEEEVCDEEQDAELFAIFIEQLEEKTTAMRSLSMDSESPEKITEALTSAMDHLQSLRSAANYMGYDKLLGFYDDWLQNITAALAEVETGDDPSTDFMRDRLRVLEDRFPELKEAADTEGDPEPPGPGSGDDDFDNVIDTFFSSDTFKEPAAVSDPEVEALFEEMEHDVYTEDLDQELFDIFLNHLTDSISALWQEGQSWSETSTPSDSLERCAGILERLRSSANYMGYSRLRSIFGQWRDKVEVSREMLASGDTVSLDFWDDYLNRIVKTFPKAEFCFNPAMAPNKTGVALPQETRLDVDAPGDLAVVDPDLFDMLSNAFDDTAMENSDACIDSFQEVIDEMIAGKGYLPVDHVLPSAAPPGSDTPSPPLAVRPLATPTATRTTGSDRTIKHSGSGDTAPDGPRQGQQRAVDQKHGRGSEKNRVGQKKFKQSVRVDADKIDYLMNQVGELVVSRAFFFNYSTT
ncbi:Signal transduction histidine kinase CheA (EC [Olavius algarvensis associated proteobacterium Delta 3]|nr:Signal transduction histidine kinase CheA (EC [Olavius algarvensis associated proteobacterium Delta 3]